MNEHVRQDDRIRVGLTIVNLAAIVSAAVLFNLWPHRVGIYNLSTAPPTFRPLLAPGFQCYLHWLNLCLGMAFGLHVAHLALRRWTDVTTWFDLAVRVLAATILFRMARDVTSIIVPAACGSARSALIGLGLCALLVPGRGIVLNREQLSQALDRFLAAVGERRHSKEWR